MSKSALLIIDIQNDYFEGGSYPLFESKQAAGQSKLILEKCRAEGMDIIHIQHISNREGASFFIPDTKGVEIHEYVKPLPNEKIIIKYFPNSFRETELLNYLKKLNIEQLIICGMMTHMCIDTTVRAAFDLGFSNTLIGDACATRDLEHKGSITKATDVQNAYLAALNGLFAKVVTTEEYLKGL